MGVSASVDDRTIDSSDPGEPRGPDFGATTPPSAPDTGATQPPPAGGWQDAPATPRKRAAESMVGQTVGRYQVLQLLGEGGFGAVYLAEQVEPVRRKVALKVMRSGSDREDLVARFEAERQAMAVMNHPGVAKVWDAGALPDGKPFFAMEFVPGKPLDEFAMPSVSTCAHAHGSSCRSATRSSTPTPRAWCTVTSSPETSWSSAMPRPST